ncbi:hypothetical protein VF10_36375 [Nostoc linckia z13]|nr:hypothetical protein VF10_36375 [Nostoc linckia z13]
MVPSKRVYLLLLLGIAIAFVLSFFLTIKTTIVITLLYDVVVLLLMVADGWQVRRYRVQITRELPPRLSIGRDNSVVLKVTSQKANAQIQIRDYYPTGFGVSAPALEAIIPSNSQRSNSNPRLLSNRFWRICTGTRGDYSQ